MCRAEYPEHIGHGALRTVLLQRQPPIDVSPGVLRQWLNRKSIKPADAITVSSADELQEKYGALVKRLVVVHATAYKLCAALRFESPAVYCSDGIAKQWLKKYGSVLQCINSAGHLELHCGGRIRENDKALLDAPELKVWLQTTLLVEASVSTCQTWRTKEWSTSGKLLSIDAVEDDIGDRLRLPQYKDRFTEDDAPIMAEVLLESQPSVVVTPLLLRQWYAKYHQDSGPLEIAIAVELGQYLGDDIHREYPYFNYWALHGVLQRRRRPVLRDKRVVRTWIEKYAPRRIIRKQSAAAVWGTAGEPSAKCAKVSCAMVTVSGASGLEEACGERYRREVSDLGLGERFFSLLFSKYSCSLFSSSFCLYQNLFYSLYNPCAPSSERLRCRPFDFPAVARGLKNAKNK